MHVYTARQDSSTRLDDSSLWAVAKAGFHAALYALVLASVSISGFVDSAHTICGDIDPESFKAWQELSPRLLNLPTQIDVGLCLLYIFMGMYFIQQLRQLNQENGNACKEGDIYMLYVLNWMCIIDSINHLVYVVTHHHRALIMNQWYSVGISAWGTSCVSHLDYGWSISRNLWYMRLSALSYSLALLHPSGFPAVVGLHVLCAVFTVISMLSAFPRPPPPITKIFYKGLFCVILFVLFNYLKSVLLDNFVLKLMPVHLMADVCTCFCFYFSMQFFMTYHYMRVDDAQQRRSLSPSRNTHSRSTPLRRSHSGSPPRRR